MDRPSGSRPPVAAGPHPDLSLGFAWVIVEVAPDGILVGDDDGRILMVNRHVEKMFGHARDSLVGAPVEWLIPARFRRTHEAHRARYVTAPALRPMGAGLGLVGCHADGSEFPIEVSLSPASTDNGIATVVVVRDVTQQRALEEAARAASALEHDEHVAAELHDHVIGSLFGSASTLASVLSRHRLDGEVAAELHGVIDSLDAAIRQIRTTVFARLGPEPTTHGEVPIH